MSKIIILAVFSIILANIGHSLDLNHKLDDFLRIYEKMLISDKTNQEKEVEYLKIFNPSDELKLMTKIGQVGGLDTNLNGNLVIFHRGSRVWQFDSFIGNQFNKIKYKTIEENTLTLIDMKRSEEMFSWGANLFYMPHGLTIDNHDNIWVTDVALHQVLKFSPKNLEQPELVLGVEFQPGNDEKHFCKPTDIAVSESNGHVFVSDGYCNQRVVEFDKDGNFLGSYEDRENSLQVVHSIGLIDKLNLICTVSRQDGRIVCFDTKTKQKVHEIIHKDMKNCYAIEYDANNEVIHAAAGFNEGKDSYGFTFYADESRFGQFKQKWNAPERDLEGVHGIALSPDGSNIYLGQLNGEIDQFTYE